jgi:hypothetical protein
VEQSQVVDRARCAKTEGQPLPLQTEGRQIRDFRGGYPRRGWIPWRGLTEVFEDVRLVVGVGICGEAGDPGIEDFFGREMRLLPGAESRGAGAGRWVWSLLLARSESTAPSLAETSVNSKGVVSRS